MNIGKWSNPEIPIEVLALKLCEEAGEVASAITDNLMAHKGPMSPKENRALVEECQHVIFLASAVKARAEKEIARRG